MQYIIATFAIFGGIFAQKFGGATMFGIGLIFIAITTLLMPLMLGIHFFLFIGTLALNGLMMVILNFINYFVNWKK